LVGAVKSKRRQPREAADLYTSPLFRGRVAYVQRTCDRWYVLTPREGLVHPNWVLTPSEESLAVVPTSHRRAWSAGVLYALVQELGKLDGHVFEIHAGATFRDYGLVEGLERRGAVVEVPARGLSQGGQLAFYAAARRDAG
jgi:hypothetical protein